MNLYKTGHPIADTISDLIGDLPDGDYKAGYGILRHSLFRDGDWFEFDRGFWDPSHYNGFYRLSYEGTQPKYHANGPSKPHGQILEPWRNSGYYTLICPPTGHVCDFFKIDLTEWLFNARRQTRGHIIIRNKGNEEPIDWNQISKVITFNSTIGFEALRRGIEVISDPIHSTIGSYTQYLGNTYCGYDRDQLFSFCAAHQFKLDDKETICNLINYYLSTSDTTHEKQSAPTF